ncbi:MAG: T9SS type A sorting domain-containing protein [Bacteroidota bacterium]
MKKIYNLILFSVLILGTFNLKATNVTGTYATNQHWTVAGGSPYIITGNVVMLADLTIDAGVLVKFNSGFQIRIASTGSLNVNGALGDSVTFTSNNAIPARGDWNQILIDQVTGAVNITYVKIMYATYGINMYTNNAINISHSRFEQCSGYGVYQSNGNGNYTLDNCSVRHNSSGAYSSGGSTILNSLISYNDSVGVVPSWTTVFIINCTLSHNYYGVSASMIGNSQIRNSNIQNNHFGIYCGTYSGTSAIGNTIQNNVIGIYTGGGTINCNNFNNNTSFNLVYRGTTGGVIDATNNYYGTTDSATIDATIYDIFDNSSLGGYFDFTPYATSLLVGPSQPSAVLGSASGCTSTSSGYSVTNVAGVSYTWSISGGGSVSGTTNTASVYWYSAGTYTVTVTPTIGCMPGLPSSMEVTVNQSPSISVNSPTICPGSTTNLLASGATSYSWLPTTGLSNSSIANPTASPITSTNYTVTGISSGCSSTANAYVSVSNVDTSIYYNGSTLYSNAWGSGITYQWLDCDNGNSMIMGETNYYFTPSNPGHYSVYIYDTYAGCSGTSSCYHVCNLNVNLNSATICLGETTTLTASGATSYSWLPTIGLSNSAIANPIASPTSSTSYTVTGTTAGCSSTAVAYVTVNTVDTSLYSSGSYLYAYSNGWVSYQWLDCNNGNSPIAGATYQTFFPAASGDYSLSITDYYTGCTGVSSCHNFILMANDTCHFTTHDTVHNFTYDTIHVSVYDTTHLMAYDTTHLNVYDTTHFSVYDTIHITAYDTTQIAVTDTLIINALLTGIIPPNNTNTIKIFPNPTSDYITIDTGTNVFMTGYTIEIKNILSVVVYSQVMSPATQYSVNLSGWTSYGTYFVSIKDLSGTVIATKTIILQ